MTTTAPERPRLDITNPGPCRGRLKHVFRRETRPSKTHVGLHDDRVVCQRCRGILFDWDGPFVPFIEKRPQ